MMACWFANLREPGVNGTLDCAWPYIGSKLLPPAYVDAGDAADVFDSSRDSTTDQTSEAGHGAVSESGGSGLSEGGE